MKTKSMRHYWRSSNLLIAGALSASLLTGNYSQAQQGPYHHVIQSENVLPQAEQNFMSNLIDLYATDEAKAQAKIGIELEMTGLSPGKIVEIAQQIYGGKIERATHEYRLLGSVFGDLRIYRDGEIWKYDDYVNDKRNGKENVPLRVAFWINDALRQAVENVFPPLDYARAVSLEKFVEELGKAGAKGPKGLQAVSFQINIEVDPRDTILIKNMLANYTNNHKVMRRLLKPALVRRGSNLPLPDAELQARLKSYDYQPSDSQFTFDFLNHAHPKSARLNIGPAILEDLDPAIFKTEKEKLIQDGWSHRPAVELREANASFSPGYLKSLIDFTIALKEVSKKTGHLNPLDLMTQVELRAQKKAVKSAPRISQQLDQIPFRHSIGRAIDHKNYVEVPMKPVDPKVFASFVDTNRLKEMGLLDGSRSLDEVKASFTQRFGAEIYRPQERDQVKGNEPKALALAYDDGYLGRGDGRAGWLFEVQVPGKGTYDFGDKGGGPTEYSIPQASIDAGYHIAEKDGYLSLEEAVIVAQTSKMLETIGVEAEGIISIIEMGNRTGFNLKPPVLQPTAKVLRFFENGLRGAHLRKYSPQEMRSVALWLRQREAIRLNRNAEDVPSTEVYLRNKIKRDAIRAALAQHFWVIHGAINPANIYENGWADIMYVEALRRPDPDYTSLNIYSSLARQPKELLKVSLQFANAIGSTDPNVKLNFTDLYWKEFNTELSRLEIISAGFTPEQAESIVKNRPDLAQQYRQVIWDLNFRKLGTDTKKLKAEVALYLLLRNKGSALSYDNVNAQTAQEGQYDRQPVSPDEFMSRKDRWQYQLSLALKRTIAWFTGKSALPVENATEADFSKLAQLTEELVRESHFRQSSVGVGVSKVATLTQFLEGLVHRSNLASVATLPAKSQFVNHYNKYLNANYDKDRNMTSRGNLNVHLTKAFAGIQLMGRNIKAAYGDLSMQSRQFIGKAQSYTPNKNRIETERRKAGEEQVRTEMKPNKAAVDPRFKIRACRSVI